MATPIYDPNRGWREFFIGEVYTGSEGAGRYVPNVNDRIWDPAFGYYIVTAIDTDTFLSTWVPWEPPGSDNDVDQDDVLLGTGPGRTSESYRAYIDTSVLPHTMALSARLRSNGTTLSYVKVFRGTDVSDTGEVISAWYDQNGDLVGENIPMELVVMEDDNRGVKTARVGWSRVAMDEGEQVTVVAYDDQGNARDTAILLVRNTNFIRTTDASAKYVISIALDTPFLAAGDNTLLQYPVNLPLSSANLIGVVTYSDGSRVRYNVDGTKFALQGMERYIATTAGQRVPLVLRYLLSQGEYSYDLAPGGDPSVMNRPYWVQTADVNGAYAVKLYTFPEWDPINLRYRLVHFLYNLDRQTVWNVTPYVEIVGGSFDGSNYSDLQQITMALNLDNVSGTFSPYRHVQTIGIALIQAGGDAGSTYYRIEATPNQNPLYGDSVYATVTSNGSGGWTYGLGAGAATQSDWLDTLYWNLGPMHFVGTESEAPTPNFARIIVGNSNAEIAVSDWDQPIDIVSDPSVTKQMYIEFIHRSVGGDLQLGKAALPIKLI